MIVIGVYCGRQQSDFKESFNASGNMGAFIVGISLSATLLSTVGYLATPGEIMKHGPAILRMLLGRPIAYVLVGYWMIPSIMRCRVTSAYEILEIRLGLAVRGVGAIMLSHPAATHVHTDQPQVTQARALAAGIGVLVIIAGLFVERAPGNYLEVSQKAFNLLVASLFGLFFMALYVLWATSIGTLVGAIFGISSAFLIAIWDVFTGQLPLGFQWIGLYSLAVQIAIGCVVSHLTQCRKGTG